MKWFAYLFLIFTIASCHKTNDKNESDEKVDDQDIEIELKSKPNLIDTNLINGSWRKTLGHGPEFLIIENHTLIRGDSSIFDASTLNIENINWAKYASNTLEIQLNAPYKNYDYGDIWTIDLKITELSDSVLNFQPWNSDTVEYRRMHE